MKESYADIQKMLEQFVDMQSAGQMAEDIRQADGLLSAVPAVEVSGETLAAIREKVHRRLAVRKIRVWTVRIEQFAAAAAAVILIGVLGWVFYKSYQPVGQKGLTSVALASIWNDEPVSTLNGKIETLTDQVESVQTATQWLDENSGLTVEIENLEQVALNTEFWKG
jgi:hypothetical protein